MEADILIRIAQLIVSAVGVAVVVCTIRQKTTSDNRAEWWKRYTWAVEQTASDNDYMKELAWNNLAILSDSSLATNTEAQLIQELAASQQPDDTGDIPKEEQTHD